MASQDYSRQLEADAMEASQDAFVATLQGGYRKMLEDIQLTQHGEIERLKAEQQAQLHDVVQRQAADLAKHGQRLTQMLKQYGIEIGGREETALFQGGQKRSHTDEPTAEPDLGQPADQVNKKCRSELRADQLIAEATGATIISRQAASDRASFTKQARDFDNGLKARNDKLIAFAIAGGQGKLVASRADRPKTYDGEDNDRCRIIPRLMRVIAREVKRPANVDALRNLRDQAPHWHDKDSEIYVDELTAFIYANFSY